MLNVPTVACTTGTWWRFGQEMNIQVAGVYEVATFYHHFEVLRVTNPPP
jgi:hypothetical protein